MRVPGTRVIGPIGAVVGINLMAIALFGDVSAVRAMGSDTAPEPCSQFTKGSKKWKACRTKAGLPTEARPEVEEAATLGYALAKADRFEEALKVLRVVEASNDVRVLTYIGFAERKLGRVDVAMGYYARALAIEPNNVATLEYLGEAHLQKGEVVAARETLARIASICGTECEAYQVLSKALAERAG